MDYQSWQAVMAKPISDGLSAKQTNSQSLNQLVQSVTACRECEAWLEPRPVIRVGIHARLLIIGQAPGTKVHASGIPWDDASGKRLRSWLALADEVFYDTDKVAIMPMGFCYPGKGRSGDLPPRPECRPLWHDKILQHLTNIRMTLLIGQYAQQAYLSRPAKTLTENVKGWRQWFPAMIPLPHPSPRNKLWLKQRPWFEAELLPPIRNAVQKLLF